jgi:hypothetical protein
MNHVCSTDVSNNDKTFSKENKHFSFLFDMIICEFMGKGVGKKMFFTVRVHFSPTFFCQIINSVLHLRPEEKTLETKTKPFRI